MSLATDLTRCQERLAGAELKASAEARKLKAVAPPVVYSELMLQLCNVAAEVNRFHNLLGSMRMAGDLEQRPPPVTVESLELAGCVPQVHVVGSAAEVDEISETRVVPFFPAHEIVDQSAQFALELAHIGDDTLRGEDAA